MKKKIALIANAWNGENLDAFICGCQAFCDEEEFDLFVFTSYSLTSFSHERQDAENSLYSMPDYSFFDAAIILGSGINKHDGFGDIVARCKEAGIPVVVQGFDAEGLPSVTISNYTGMRGICDHIIENHQVKDVFFFAGDKGNVDSNERLQALKDSLVEHGCSFNDENVLYTNWDGYIVNNFITALNGDKSKLPDAIVCANDTIAMFVLTSLEMNGFMAPEDVIVTGFDNIKEAREYSPSLSSVDQCYSEQGYECVSMLFDSMNNGKQAKKKVISCFISPGESCGCINCKNEQELRRLLGHDDWNRRLFNSNFQRRVNELEAAITSSDEYDQVFDKVNNDFLIRSGNEGDNFHVYINPMFKDLAYLEKREHITTGEYFAPVIDAFAARTDGVASAERTLCTNDLILGYKNEGKGKAYIFSTLLIDESVVGYTVMNYLENGFRNQVYSGFRSRMASILEKYQHKLNMARLHRKEIDALKEINHMAKEQFKQTVLALATSIDAKDKYTHGHSGRVADYSRKIANMTGKSEEMCEQVYFAALLHDVGKIGVSDTILTKEGKLTNDEFGAIKQHTGIGNSILSEVSSTPYLSIGAHYHHERYDGKGYPEGLKGKEIPDIARIIAVADAYDAMTSNRSYRTPLAQQKVREELVMGLGRQFDPEYARAMIHILDMDVEYRLTDEAQKFAGLLSDYSLDEYKEQCTHSMKVTDCITRISFTYESADGSMPSIVVFDSLDEKVYTDEANQKKMDYTGFCDISFTGEITADQIRDYQVTEYPNLNNDNMADNSAVVETLKQGDHVLVRIIMRDVVRECTLVLRDRSQWVFAAITGSKMTLSDVKYSVEEAAAEPKYIKRIAEEISYINGMPEGNLSNIEIGGWREKHTDGILLENKIDFTFNTMSLPSSRRLWHCPILVLYTSDDGTVYGTGYREFSVLRLDGESWTEDSLSTVDMDVSFDETFTTWNDWKAANRNGLTCKMHIDRAGNKIFVSAEEGGLHMDSVTTIEEDELPKLYCALTGDQVALTTINVN